MFTRIYLNVRNLLVIAVYLVGLIVLAMTGIALSTSCVLASPLPIDGRHNQLPSPQPINIYITDFGIEQWKKELRLGGDLSQAKYRLLPPSSGAVGIAVPMPDDKEFNTLSTAELRARIRKSVRDQVQKAIHDHGTKTFEIQLMQNISIPGYADPTRQKMVDRFGAIAYSAIGDVIAELERKNQLVRTRAFTLSNGTKVLAANIAALYNSGKLYLEGADLVNGRAMKGPTGRLISVLGERNVRLFATRGDLAAPPGASIGNFDTLVDLKDLHPLVKVYLLTPSPMHLLPQDNHVAILNPKQLFTVQEYIGDGLLLAVNGTNLRSQELLRMPTTPGSQAQYWQSKLDDMDYTSASRTLGDKLKAVRTPLIRVNKDTAENLLAAVTTYASVLDVARKNAEELAEIMKNAPHEDPRLHSNALKRIAFFRNMPLNDRERVLLKGAKFVQSAMGLVDGLRKDLENNSHGRYSFFTSHTLEAVGNFGLDHIDFISGLIDEKYLPKESLVRKGLDYLDVIREFNIAIAKHAGKGNVDVDIVTHYLNGSKALLKAGLKQKRILKGRFALLDGIQELGTAAYKSARGDALSPDLVTEYLEAINNLAWTGLGLAACGANYECTAAIQTFGTTLAKLLRTGSEKWFADVLIAFSGNSSKIIGDYLQLQQAAIAHGRPMQAISEIYTRELLKQNGMSDAQIDRLDALVTEKQPISTANYRNTINAHQKTTTVRSVEQSSKYLKDNRGGVDLGTGTPQVEKHDLSNFTRSVLDGR